MIMKKKKKGEATINLYMNELKGGLIYKRSKRCFQQLYILPTLRRLTLLLLRISIFVCFFFSSSFFYSFLYLPSLLHWFPSFLFSTAQEGRFLELGPSISIIFIFCTSFFCLFTFTFTVTFNLTVTHLNSSTNHFIFFTTRNL